MYRNAAIRRHRHTLAPYLSIEPYLYYFAAKIQNLALKLAALSLPATRLHSTPIYSSIYTPCRLNPKFNLQIAVLEFPRKIFFPGVKFCLKKIYDQKILVKNFDISHFLPAKIIIDSIFRGKILYYVKKLPPKILTAKNFYA